MRTNFNRTRMTEPTNRQIYKLAEMYVAEKRRLLQLAVEWYEIREYRVTTKYRLRNIDNVRETLSVSAVFRPKFSTFFFFSPKTSLRPSISESYECTVGIRRKRQKHRELKKERRREVAACRALWESRIAIVIAVTCVQCTAKSIGAL